MLQAEAVARVLGKGFVRESRPEYRSRDRSLGLEIKGGLRSLRDLRDAFVQLASLSAEKGTPHRLALVVHMPQISRERMEAEWSRFRDLLKPPFARKLHLLAMGYREPLIVPDQRGLRDLEVKLEPLFRPGPKEELPELPTERFFEVFKVLLLDWLRRPGPVPIKRLLHVSGASYTAVAQSLRRLERSRELRRHRSGAVELNGFPGATWREIVTLIQPLRRSRYYKDASGRNAHPKALFRAIGKVRPTGMAVGGTYAAERIDPHFDLHGTPRLDVALHSPDGTIPEETIRGLLFTLQRCDRDDPGVILAVHPVRRREPLFDADPKRPIRWADPVEVLLDLLELKLTHQAEALHQILIKRRPVTHGNPRSSQDAFAAP